MWSMTAPRLEQIVEDPGIKFVSLVECGAISLIVLLYAHITDFAITWWRCSFGVELRAAGSADCELAFGHADSFEIFKVVQ